MGCLVSLCVPQKSGSKREGAREEESRESKGDKHQENIILTIQGTGCKCLFGRRKWQVKTSMRALSYRKLEIIGTTPYAM